MTPVIASANVLNATDHLRRKAVTDTQNTQPETTEMLYKAFPAHVKLKQARISAKPLPEVLSVTHDETSNAMGQLANPGPYGERAV
jgi:hypothetical protein